MNRNVVCIDGISPSLVPGLLSAVGLTGGRGNGHCFSKGPLHFPFRIAKQGVMDRHCNTEAWRVSPALIDNDILLVVDDTSFTGPQLQLAVAEAVYQPCSVSFAAAADLQGNGTHPAWLLLPPQPPVGNSYGGRRRGRDCVSTDTPSVPGQRHSSPPWTQSARPPTIDMRGQR